MPRRLIELRDVTFGYGDEPVIQGLTFEIAAGEKVVMYYSAADFDETVFPDPLRFDVGRPQAPPNVAFGGGGAHFCLGASLARLELAELIDEILDRNLEIEVIGEPEFVDSNFVNGIEHVEVRVR